MLVIFRQNTKVIALLFGQKSLIFITCQSAIKINQLLVWTVVSTTRMLQPYFLAKNRSFSSLFNLQSQSINFNVGHFPAKYQGYSLTFWPKIAHFFIMFQSAMKINQFQCWSVFGKIPRLQPYLLAKNRSFSSPFNLQSKSINFNVGHLLAKYQGYSLALWPKIAHFHHLSICNQTQSTSSLVSCRQNTKVMALLVGQKSLIFITVQSAIKINQFECWSFFGKIPRVQPYFLANNRSCLYNVSICNQYQSMSILVICRQTTKGIALLFGQQSLIFITFQSAIKINQFQYWSSVGKIPKLWP